MGQTFSAMPPDRDLSTVRTIDVHVPREDFSPFQAGIADNRIQTSRYNVATFLPKSLFEQFRRTANVYFLVVAILMVIGTYTPLYNSPLAPYSTALPLVFVLGVSMMKDALEDKKRHRDDRRVNEDNKVDVLNPERKGEFVSVSWKDVRVGNIVQLRNRDQVPADMVLLASSESHGTAYVETSQIDGETNLKIRNSAPTKAGLPPGPLWSSPEDLHGVRMHIDYEEPNAKIHFFMGTIRLRDEGGAHREVPVNQDNFLIRGSILRNCRWALGVVVYTGVDTKLIQNSRKAPSKQSNVDRVTNKIMIVIFAALAVITTTSVIGYYLFNYNYKGYLSYLCVDFSDSPDPFFRDNCNDSQNRTGGAVGLWFTFLILYSNFVPISLYVTLEIVNVVLVWYIEQDGLMHCKESGTYAKARTTNLNGDLGQVEYVFSDKTGTLTQNVMKFKRCSVGGCMYGEISEDELSSMTAVQRRRARNAPPIRALKERIDKTELEGGSAEMDFALCLALNHTVVIEGGGGEGGLEKPSMQAESPDELALVDGAASLGISFVSRNVGELRVMFGDREATYSLLTTIAFDSTRKRMSMLVRSPAGRIILFCKGADNIIMDRSSGLVSGSMETLKEHLSVFSSDGLRTLLLARRELTEEEYASWHQKWQAASVAIKGRAEAMAAAAEEIERDLMILGVTAIEDKLQDGVPSTIADLGRAGIKLWVLTGDKMETAINIGYSCRLLEPGMTLIRLQEPEDGDFSQILMQLEGLCVHFCRLAEDEKFQMNIWERMAARVSRSPLRRSSVLAGAGADTPPPSLPESLIERPKNSPSLSEISVDSLALIVDGPSLQCILGQPEVERLFFQVARLCRSVIACRVSPMQKRLVVNLVKRLVKPKPITLAIGDGANDVAMIQEAQLGVGISGREGRQAVNNADFAISQFRFLKRLLLVHGHYNYRRLCKVILYSFYKNVCLVFVLFWYSFFTGFSGQSLFESIVYMGFNWFLAMPILLIGIFDKDVSERTVEALPLLYGIGIRNTDLSKAVAVRWIVQSLIDSLLIFFLPLGAYWGSGSVWATRGITDGLYTFGTTVYSCLIMVMMLKAASLTWVWNWVSVAFFVGSILFFYTVILVYSLNLTIGYDFYWVAYQMLARSAYWLLNIQIPFLSWSVHFFFVWVGRAFFPSYSDHAIEFDRLGSPDDLASTMKAHVDTEELKRDEEMDLGVRRDRTSRKLVLSKSILRELNDDLGEERKMELGIEEVSETHPRSSYAFDFVSHHLGRGASLAEEEIGAIEVAGSGGERRRSQSVSLTRQASQAVTSYLATRRSRSQSNSNLSV